MRKYIYWLLPMVWMGVIFYSSNQPYEKQDVRPFLKDVLDLSLLTPYLDWISFSYHHAEVSVDTLGVAGLLEFFIRKAAHVTVFFILMIVFYVAIRKWALFKMQVCLTLSFVLTVAYAVVDEVHQGFTGNRTPYAGDVFLDSIGAMVALLLLTYVHRYKRRSKTKQS